MKWLNPEQIPPLNGTPVLVVKIYLNDFGWTSPFCDIDQAWAKSSGECRWDKGGKVTHWMPLPEMPDELSKAKD